MSGWVDRFFDEHYLETYGPRLTDDASEEEALQAIDLAGVKNRADILDCPCGFGRHTIPLLRGGYNAIGLDRSPIQLAEARRRAGERDSARFVEGDYRSLPFADESFDAILCLFTSLGYYDEDDDRAVLREFRRVVRPGGRVILETVHRDFVVRDAQPRSWESLPNGGFFLVERSFDPVRGVNMATHILVRRDGTVESRFRELRVYSVTELVAHLENVGFGDILCYGTLSGDELTPETRLAVVARRPTGSDR